MSGEILRTCGTRDFRRLRGLAGRVRAGRFWKTTFASSSPVTPACHSSKFSLITDNPDTRTLWQEPTRYYLLDPRLRADVGHDKRDRSHASPSGTESPFDQALKRE